MNCPEPRQKDTRDVIIQQLKREVEELRKNQEDYNELRAKLDTEMHISQMLNSEKQRLEDNAQHVKEKNIRMVAQLKSEIESLTFKLGELEYDNKNLNKQNDLFEESLTKREEDFYNLEKEFKADTRLKQEINSELKQ